AEFCTPDYKRVVQKICNRYTPDEMVIRTYQNGITLKYYTHFSTRLKQRAADTLRHPMTLCLIGLVMFCCLFQKCSPAKGQPSCPKIPVLLQPPQRASLPISERVHS
ncbi:MAG: hypothetical protein ACI4QM_01905, partial [Alphaproteobacteria bacterium]